MAQSLDKQAARLKLRKELRQWRDVLPYIALGIIGTSVFVIYPMIKGIWMSFTKYNIMPGADSPYVGFANYTKAFHSEFFWYAVRNTFLNTLVTVPLLMLIGLLLAILVNQKFIRAKITLRMIYYFPVITSWIVIAYLFKYLFAGGEFGLVNYIFYKQLGWLSAPVDWLQHEWTGLTVIWVLHIFKTFGWAFIIYIAALQSVPKALYEAAEIDGAGSLATVRFLTVPMIRATTIFIFINAVIGAFNIFPHVYFITGGGPLGRTQVLPVLIYKEAFDKFEFGYSAALSVMMGLTIFALTYFQQRKIGQSSDYS